MTIEVGIEDADVVWNGSTEEMTALVAAVEANVTCSPNCDDLPDVGTSPICATHRMLCSQATLDRMLAMRRSAAAAEHRSRVVGVVLV